MSEYVPYIVRVNGVIPKPSTAVCYSEENNNRGTSEAVLIKPRLLGLDRVRRQDSIDFREIRAAWDRKDSPSD
jgi:hypothetical protein